MRVDKHAQQVVVAVTDRVSLDAKEAGFLRVMARHCIETKMAGNVACQNLIKALDAALIPEWSPEPTGWYFEERGP